MEFRNISSYSILSYLMVYQDPVGNELRDLDPIGRMDV
jgi:hypothetical protein